MTIKLQTIHTPPLLHVITRTWLDFVLQLVIYAAFSHLPDIKSLTVSKHEATLSLIFFALKTTLELQLKGDEAAFPVTPLFASQPTEHYYVKWWPIWPKDE